jgi:hypothetical protein
MFATSEGDGEIEGVKTQLYLSFRGMHDFHFFRGIQYTRTIAPQLGKR